MGEIKINHPSRRLALTLHFLACIVITSNQDGDSYRGGWPGMQRRSKSHQRYYDCVAYDARSYKYDGPCDGVALLFFLLNFFKFTQHSKTTTMQTLTCLIFVL